jgi:hypothetical protein
MLLKEMVVTKTSKVAFDHLIAEISRPIVLRDPAGVFENDAEVTASPCDFLPRADQPRCDSGDRLLTSPVYGACMQVDASS